MAGNKNSGFASHPENINRAGRPKEGALTDILREFGDMEDVEFSGDKIARKRALSQRLWQKALEGDIQCIKYIFDRIDGRPTERHEVEGNMPTVIFSGIDEPE